MADPLSAAAVNQSTILGFVAEYEAVEDEISEAASVKAAAVGKRKRLRKRIETAGITLAQFERARGDAAKSPEARAREDAEHRLYLDFMTKPPGFQATMDMPASAPEGLRKLNTAELKRIDRAGFQAGFSGIHERSENPHPVASEAWQRWDTAFNRGVSSKELEGGGKSFASAPQDRLPASQRRRGRRAPPPPAEQPAAQAQL